LVKIKKLRVPIFWGIRMDYQGLHLIYDSKVSKEKLRKMAEDLGLKKVTVHFKHIEEFETINAK